MQDAKQEQKQDQELFDRIVKHIGEFVEADVSHLTPESNIGNSIEGMSSLKMVELLLFLEDCFGVDFDESVMDDLQTMRDLEQYIRRTLDASGQRA
ncbi:phosphopantetheine-binding protein [Streptomyces sp. NPDC050703]|uniref:acyl carrier protein n=1 Tax=Streptomyces sp. NPDC050703 TaxID=3157218 RepID=UPI0034182B3D